MVDIPATAAALGAVLAPAMPFLLSKAGEGAAKKLGEDSWALAKTTWGQLGEALHSNPMAIAAAEEIAYRPNDERARAALELQLEKILTKDTRLGGVKILLPGLGASGQVV